MSYSSCLANIADPLILDTSVLINLHACGYGERILENIPNCIVISDVAARELEHETSRRNGGLGFLNSLLAAGIVSVTSLTDEESDLFGMLTSSTPSLDDGEAATIAVAVARQLLPVIDERKGRKRAGVLMGERVLGWSLDIFLHPLVIAALGNPAAVDAIYLALRDGRMRIPLESVESAIQLIGNERSRECTCLPGYRERFTNIAEPSTCPPNFDVEMENDCGS